MPAFFLFPWIPCGVSSSLTINMHKQ